MLKSLSMQTASHTQSKYFQLVEENPHKGLCEMGQLGLKKQILQGFSLWEILNKKAFVFKIKSIFY